MSTRKSTIFYGFLIAFASLVVGMVIASRLDLAPGSFASSLRVPPTNSAALTGPLDATTFRNIAKEASPSVVSIDVKITAPAGDSGMQDFFGFQFPFGGRQGQGQQRQGPARPQIQEGAGSGFIIDKTNGYILTNNHVVENAKTIDVFLSTMKDSESEGLPAKVIGRDPVSDVALIQLTEMPKEALSEAKFGDSDQMAPGDWVMAIGNPFRLSGTVTVGVVSAVGRETSGNAGRPEEMIQTDAAINKGNSGGPLLNIRGEVVGVNSMILTDGLSEGNVGVGFAIPINTVRDLLPQLKEGKVVRGRIGVSINPRPLTQDYAESLGLPNTNGAEVQSVQAGPARTAGMKAGDVIVEFNGKPVKNYNELVRTVTSTAPGTTVPVKVIRDKKPITLNVKVEELDVAAEQASADGTGRGNVPQAPQAAPKDTDFGMQIQDLTAREQRQLQLPAGRTGAVVTDVTPGSPAAAAGVQPDDVILSVGGTAVHSADDVAKALDGLPAGRTVRMIVWRDNVETLIVMRKR